MNRIAFYFYFLTRAFSLFVEHFLSRCFSFVTNHRLDQGQHYWAIVPLLAALLAASLPLLLLLRPLFSGRYFRPSSAVPRNVIFAPGESVAFAGVLLLDLSYL